MMRFFILMTISLLIITGCVPNKKLVYLQKGKELKESVLYDSIVREYQLANYEYRVQPEDILSIRIESLTQDEFNIFAKEENQLGVNQNNLAVNGYLVDLDGTISFPEIGKVKVAGLTLHEVENKVKEVTTVYLDAPSVKVRLLNFRVTLLGEVNQEGTIFSFNNRITIMEAIGLGGGMGELADRSKVKIVRQSSGESQIIYVNLLDEELMNEQGFFVHQNDIIIVPPLKQRPFRKYFGPNLSLFVSTLSILLLTINLISQ